MDWSNNNVSAVTAQREHRRRSRGIRSPATRWAPTELLNTTYEPGLVVRRGNLIAVNPDDRSAERLQKWIDGSPRLAPAKSNTSGGHAATVTRNTLKAGAEQMFATKDRQIPNTNASHAVHRPDPPPRRAMFVGARP